MKFYSYSYLTLATFLLPATVSIAQQRQPTHRRHKAIVTKSPSDSVMLRRKAIYFIKQVKEYALADSKFKLENQPASLSYMGCLQAVLADKQTFTPLELKAIEMAANKKSATWSSTEFADDKLINTDTISAVFKNKLKGWRYFHEHIAESVHSFSFPIFIRNNMYCLFYAAMYCGELCAEGDLILYKKSGANWIIVKRYCSWVS